MGVRKCPFCRRDLAQGTEKCPNCNRVLIEKISESPTGSANTAHIPQSKKNDHKKIWSFKRTLNYIVEHIKRKKPQKIYYAYQYDKWKRIKKIFLISVGLGVILVLAILIELSNNQTIKTNDQSPTQASSQPAVHKPIISLPNGTIINSVPGYFNGLGKLSIENGTDLDSVAKLINSSKKSIFTVFIKADNNYTINGIVIGRYELFFAHGRDWNSSTNSFLLNRSFSKFEDSFDFTVHDEYRSDGTYQVYSTYDVTLHPVVGGKAKTDSVSEDEFTQL